MPRRTLGALNGRGGIAEEMMVFTLCLDNVRVD